MLKANRQFVEVEVPEIKTGFVASDGNVIEGVVVSVGDEVKYIKKKDRVLFDTNKALQHSVKGKNHYFVKDETILAYESNK